MTNKSVALRVVAGAVVCGTALVVAITYRPASSLEWIDTLPIKAVLSAVAIGLVFVGSAICFGIFYLPNKRKFCVVMGSTLVGAALSGCLAYSTLAIGSAHLKYASQNGNISADIAIDFDTGSAAFYSLGMLVLAVFAGMFFVTAYAILDFSDQWLASRAQPPLN